jgi:hypothetical protein
MTPGETYDLVELSDTFMRNVSIVPGKFGNISMVRWGGIET